MKKCRIVGVYLHTFTSAVGGVGWSASLLSLGNSSLPIHGTGDKLVLAQKKIGPKQK
jgi:hypothetical protein